ncbi:MAG: hypothetical protein HUU02_03725 [Bacteroidetes bacterium]|nr:hypothetical protein [Bacteroidota bacterium]
MNTSRQGPARYTASVPSAVPHPFVRSFPLLLLLLALFLNSCGSSYPAPGVDGKKYRYIYLLSEPSVSPKLAFQDANVSFTFTVDDAAISYTMLSLTRKDVWVESAGATFVMDSQYIPVRNIMSLYSDSVKGFAPLYVAPRGYLQDIIIPHQHIRWDEDEGWKEKDIFPTLDSGTVSGRARIAKNLGKQFELHIPVLIGERRKVYKFVFKVSAIKVVSPDAPVAAKQRPPAPDLDGASSGLWYSLGLIGTTAAVTSAIVLYVTGQLPLK